jgi:hypothetical protein
MNIITESENLINAMEPDLLELAIEDFKSDPKFGYLMDKPMKFTNSSATNFIIRNIMEVGIFDDLVENIEVGEYSTTTFVQLYKFENYYVVLSTYIGSCAGCLEPHINNICAEQSEYMSCHDSLLYYKNTIIDYIKQQIYKSSIHCNLHDAKSEFNNQVSKIDLL